MQRSSTETLKHLVAVCRQLSALLDQRAVMELVCQTARELVAAEGACFVLRENQLVYYCEEDTVAPLWKGQRFPISNCISGWSILHQQPVVISDIYDDERIPIEYYRSTFIKSLAMMPIRSVDPLGALGVYWATQHQATEQQLELLEMLADTTAIALVNIQLFEEMQTARRQAEQQAAQLAQVNRLKDEFLATVSHELRTPLNAILGWAAILRHNKLDPVTSGRALETIERNARAQTHLIDDILDVSRIITGKLQLAVQPVRLAAVIETAVESVRPAATAKGITLGLRHEAQSDLITGDLNRLQQIVWNLLSNAVKFTPPGGRVEVQLRQVAATVEISISDTGQGISSEFLPHVFDRFSQADSTMTRQHGGLGLGLAIVRHLVEMQGGVVSAESAGEGQGATFRVSFPLMLTTHEAGLVSATEPAVQPAMSLPSGQPPLQPLLAGLRVLVVDDEADTRELLTWVLTAAGAQVRLAASAAETLQIVLDWHPDVLLSDLAMPEEDGYSLMRKIRTLSPEQGGLVPAAALTAHARVEDRQKVLGAGFHAHLAKPIDPVALTSLIADLAHRPVNQTGH